MLENARRVLSNPNFVRKRLLPATFLILALLAAVIFFSMGARSNAEVEYTGALDLSISHDYEQLEMITVQGTPEERGRQYGEQLKEAIEVNLGIFWETIDQKGYSKEEALLAGQEFEENMLQVDPVVINKIAGMAGSTGISYEELLAFNALVEVIFDEGCTTLIATGTATKDGKAYFHKTTDASGLPMHVATEVITEDENNNFIYVGSAGDARVAFGINEHGLSTGNTAQSTWDTGSGLGNITINRRILEKSSNVAEAVAYVESLDGNRSSGSTFLVADANEGVIMEATHSAMAVKWVVDEAIAITNHYTLPEMLEYCTRDTGGSHVREARGNELLQENLGNIDVEVMIDISQDRNEADEDWSISRPSSVSAGTFDGTNLLMYAQLGRPGDVPVELYDLGEIFGIEKNVQEAIAAIEAIPDTLTLYDMMKVRTPRGLVERALRLGASPADIHNLAALEAAEEYLDNLYRQDYMRQSILDLQAPYPPDIDGLDLFARNRRASWWEHGRTVNNVCFLPLGSLTVSYANIDTPRWINYDISGKGYTHVKGYVGITDQDSRVAYPLTFQIHGDGNLLFDEVVEYGEEAKFYLLDIEDVETLRFTIFAEETTAGGGANRIKMVEPQFLIPISDDMLTAIDDAESAIAALPDTISLSDEAAVKDARSVVEDAFSLGVDKVGRIGNLDKLQAAEEKIHSLYDDLYEKDSLFMLGNTSADNASQINEFDNPERWDVDTNTGHTVNRVSFDPLKSFFTSYINVDAGRWAEWDISDRDYDYVEGYAGISDETHNFGRPLQFTVYGDDVELFSERLDYGRDAVFYRLDIEGVEKIKVEWKAATEYVTSTGGAMVPVIVEPMFLYTLPDHVDDAVQAAESAIDELPDIITLEDEEAVEAARALVEAALAKGAVITNIDNISRLENAEQVINALKAVQAADEIIAALPVPVNLEDAETVRDARARVEEALEFGAAEGDLENLAVLEAAEAALAELNDMFYSADSLFTLEPKQHDRMTSFIDYTGERWSVGVYTIKDRCFAPLSFFRLQYSNINPDNPNHTIPYVIYDISGLGFEQVHGYTGAGDAVTTDKPVKFSIYGDNQLLYETLMVYDEEAEEYLVDIAGVDELMIRITAEYDGWVNRLAIIEPIFIRLDPDKAIENIKGAIANLPAEITLDDKNEVEKVRWMVNNAISIGVQEEDIDNLGDLEAAEAALADLTDLDYGDVNEDGAVNIQDVIMVMQYILDLIQLDEDQQLAADVDGSGDIDIDDVVLIMQYILSLIDKFPVEN